jgi:steroid delta-isomerase-like uncharacterized protein
MACNLLGISVNRGKIFSGSRHKHLVEQAKIVLSAHVLGLAWVHYTAVELQPAGESGRERRIFPMSEENKELARRSWEMLVNEHNPDAIDELYTPDFVWHEPDQDIQGPEEGKQFLSTYLSAFPDMRVTVEDEIAEGEKVVTRWTIRGTHQGEIAEFGEPTGKQVEIKGITIHRIEDGKIAEEWERYDNLSIMQQLGAISEVGQAGSY